MKKSLLFLGLITIFSFSECLAKSTCSGYDIATNSVNITSISSRSVNYNFEIKNTGDETLFFNQLTIQNYLTADNKWDAEDSPAGSAVLSYTGGTELAPGETFQQLLHCYFFRIFE